MFIELWAGNSRNHAKVFFETDYTSYCSNVRASNPSVTVFVQPNGNCSQSYFSRSSRLWKLSRFLDKNRSGREREKDLTRFSPNCACVKSGKGTYSVCHEIAQVVSPDVPGRDTKGQLNFSASVSCLNRGIGWDPIEQAVEWSRLTGGELCAVNELPLLMSWVMGIL